MLRDLYIWTHSHCFCHVSGSDTRCWDYIFIASGSIDWRATELCQPHDHPLHLSTPQDSSSRATGVLKGLLHPARAAAPCQSAAGCGSACLALLLPQLSTEGSWNHCGHGLSAFSARHKAGKLTWWNCSLTQCKQLGGTQWNMWDSVKTQQSPRVSYILPLLRAALSYSSPLARIGAQMKNN